MTGPVNSVMGDLDEPTKVPQTNVPEIDLVEEQKLAKFSKTAEFKRLKDYIDSRIEFFQKHLPDGTPVVASNQTNWDWTNANVVIGEFKAILDAYENANEAVNARPQTN